ncbi:MAG: hypothetical protein GEU92_13645 [Alphaproteobacteria bacterium]|nr:hypothetical protein [Alphaproteobacteria bacterium]
MQPAIVSISNLSKTYATGFRALSGIDTGTKSRPQMRNVEIARAHTAALLRISESLLASPFMSPLVAVVTRLTVSISQSRNSVTIGRF